MQQDQTQELDLKHGVEQGRVFLENEKGGERGRKQQGGTSLSAISTADKISALSIVDELVARTFRMPCSALHASTRCRKTTAFARQIAMYLGHVCLSYPLKDIAQHYRRDRTTVAHACSIVEDRREEEEIELLLNSLESALQTMMLMSPLAFSRP